MAHAHQYSFHPALFQHLQVFRLLIGVFVRHGNDCTITMIAQFFLRLLDKVHEE